MESPPLDIQKWANHLLHPARGREITTLVLDHVPHEAKRARGSGRKKEEVDVQWDLHNSEYFDRDTVGRVRLKRMKDREGWLPEKVYFRLGGEDGRFVFEREGSSSEDPKLKGNPKKLLKILQEKFDKGATDGEWQKACVEYEEVPESSFYHAKKKLLKEGYVEERNGKFYSSDR